MTRIFSLCLVVILALFLLFYRLGSTYLVSFDEAFYGVMAKEMASNNTWHTITFDGGAFFGASPLYIWLEALWFKLFGISEFGARFFSAVSSLGTGILVYWYFARRTQYIQGILAVLVLFSTIKFLYISRVGNLDATLTFLTTVSLFLWQSGLQNPRYFLYAGIAMGLAFLTKGFFGLWPLATITTYSVLFQHPFLRSRELGRSVIVFLLVVLPWSILQTMLYGTLYIKNYFLGYMGGKIGSLPLEQQFWWAGELLQGMKLWLPVALVVLVGILLSRRLRDKIRFFVIAVLVYLFALSLLQTHFDWYLMPLYPISALLIGEALGMIQGRFSRRAVLSGVAVLAVAHLTHYQHLFIVPQTTDAQVAMVREADRIAPPGTSILLDDYYFPVAKFYTNRPINHLRANRDAQAGIDDATLNNHLAQGSVLLTNTYTQNSVKKLSRYRPELIHSHGELLLYRPVVR